MMKQYLFLTTVLICGCGTSKLPEDPMESNRATVEKKGSSKLPADPAGSYQETVQKEIEKAKAKCIQCKVAANFQRVEETEFIVTPLEGLSKIRIELPWDGGHLMFDVTLTHDFDLSVGEWKARSSRTVYGGMNRHATFLRKIRAGRLIREEFKEELESASCDFDQLLSRLSAFNEKHKKYDSLQ